MLAWLKKVADLKTEAREKKNPLTAEGFRLSQRMVDEMKARSPGAAPSLETVLETAAKHDVLNHYQSAVVHVRGFRFALSFAEGLDEHGTTNWHWHLSVSGDGKDEDLERALETIGVPRKNGRFEASHFAESPVLHFIWPDEAPVPNGGGQTDQAR